jgi:hypothetical protein
MNVASLTSRYLRSLVKMKGRLEADLTAVNTTLQKFDAGAIPAAACNETRKASLLSVAGAGCCHPSEPS